MTRQEIEEKVNAFLMEEFELEEGKLTPEALLREDIGLDSLDIVDVAVAVKKIFGFRINTAEMGEVKTLTQFYDYIERNTTL